MRKAMTKETKPSEVGGSSKQGGEVWERFPWAEPAVWTDRMLAALVTRVKGNKWLNVYFRNLGLFSQVAAHSLACQSSRR